MGYVSESLFCMYNYRGFHIHGKWGVLAHNSKSMMKMRSTGYHRPCGPHFLILFTILSQNPHFPYIYVHLREQSS